MAKVPTMIYRAFEEGDERLDTENGPVGYKVVELEDGEGLPSGWVGSPADVGQAPAPKKRGRPPKTADEPIETPEPDAE